MAVARLVLLVLIGVTADSRGSGLALNVDNTGEPTLPRAPLRPRPKDPQVTGRGRLTPCVLRDDVRGDLRDAFDPLDPVLEAVAVLGEDGEQHLMSVDGHH